MDNTSGVGVLDKAALVLAALEAGPLSLASLVQATGPRTGMWLLAALSSLEIVPGRASFMVRLWTPVAKGINRLRGNPGVGLRDGAGKQL